MKQFAAIVADKVLAHPRHLCYPVNEARSRFSFFVKQEPYLLALGCGVLDEAPLQQSREGVRRPKHG
ncbi:MAG: hypothetical protein HYS67_09665 [Deltaproteobacteria bacterium]|nr:hypothetical protein [Deltaproteobacteria bacterium]